MEKILMDAHRQWASRPADQRYQSIESLSEAVSARRKRSRSTDIALGAIEVTDQNGLLVVNSEIEPAEPTHWSFGQLAASVKAPAGYLRTLPMPLVIQNLNHGLKHNIERTESKFMTIANEDGLNTLQAVTSPTYGRIWDADVVSAVERVVEKSEGKFHNPRAYKMNGDGRMNFGGDTEPSGLYASDHDVFMFMIDGGSILEGGDRAKLNRGFMVWNSETGAKTFGLMTFLFNVVCGNHIIWGAQDVNKLLIRHTANGPYRFESEAPKTLKAYIEASEVPLLDTVRKAQDYLLPKLGENGGVTDEFLGWTKKHGNFTRTEVQSAVSFAKSEEGECRTLWQFVQGATAYARGFDYIDSRVDLEKRAGSLLDIVSGN